MNEENLKVNAKTSTLEFKRKHNKLVDKVNEGGSDVVKLYRHSFTLRLKNETTQSTKDVPIEFLANFDFNQWQFSSVDGNSIITSSSKVGMHVFSIEIHSSSLIGFLKEQKREGYTASRIVGVIKDLSGNSYSINSDQTGCLVDVVEEIEL